MTRTRVWDGIVVAGDEGRILLDDDGPRDEVRCDACGACFAPSDADGATFDGEGARYRCPVCGEWSDGPPPA